MTLKFSNSSWLETRLAIVSKQYWVVSYHSILETIRGSFIDRMDIYGYFTFMSRSRNAFLRKPHELFGEMHPNLSIKYRYTVYNTRYFPKSSSNSQYVTGLVIDLQLYYRQPLNFNFVQIQNEIQRLFETHHRQHVIYQEHWLLKLQLIPYIDIVLNLNSIQGAIKLFSFGRDCDYYRGQPNHYKR